MRIFNPGEESMRLFMSLFPMRWNLRVVARSDSQEDQERKLKARDAVLAAARMRPMNLSALRRAARSVDPTARVRMIFYPPENPQPTVQVTLGQGRGHNWLGMLFPGAFGTQAGPTRFRWWFAEMLKGWGWL